MHFYVKVQCQPPFFYIASNNQQLPLLVITQHSDTTVFFFSMILRVFVLLWGCAIASGIDECVDISSAVTCAQRPRYTVDGCQCACDWHASFKDPNTGQMIAYTGPGATSPCTTGCCNPNSDPDGDWCYPEDNAFNRARSCSMVGATCLAAGAVPATGTVAPRAPIAGIPDNQNNLCTNSGQLCVDPDITTADDWQCHCVPAGGTVGQQALATCGSVTGAPDTDAPKTYVPTASPTAVPTAAPTLTPQTEAPLALAALSGTEFLSAVAEGQLSTDAQRYAFTKLQAQFIMQ